MKATFKTVDAPTEASDGTGQRKIDVVELTYPDGKIGAFPATDVSPETGQRYCDMWAGKYKAFKNGEPDPERVDELKREIAERQAELDSLHHGTAKDDDRLNTNLGYGKAPPDEKSNKAARKTKDKAVA